MKCPKCQHENPDDAEAMRLCRETKGRVDLVTLIRPLDTLKVAKVTMNKILIWSLALLLLIALSNKAEGETTEPSGEIRVADILEHHEGSSACKIRYTTEIIPYLSQNTLYTFTPHPSIYEIRLISNH
jgi:hypothetical protein